MEKDYIKWIRSKVGIEPIIAVSASAVIYNEQGQVLLQKRVDNNLWGFPGGFLEYGESVEECAVREIAEETGLKIEITKLIGVYSKFEYIYESGDVAQPVAMLFESKVIGGSIVINDGESLDLKYFSVDSFPPLFNKQHEAFKFDVVNKNYGVIK